MCNCQSRGIHFILNCDPCIKSAHAMQAEMNDLIDIVKCVLCNWETRFLEFQGILMCTCVEELNGGPTPFQT